MTCLMPSIALARPGPDAHKYPLASDAWCPFRSLKTYDMQCSALRDRDSSRIGDSRLGVNALHDDGIDRGDRKDDRICVCSSFTSGA